MSSFAHWHKLGTNRLCPYLSRLIFRLFGKSPIKLLRTQYGRSIYAPAAWALMILCRPVPSGCGGQSTDIGRDMVWQLRHDKANAWKIIYLDEDLDDTGEDTVECLIASPNVKSPEGVYIEQETAMELLEAMDTLPDRENAYVQYRFGFTDGKAHPLTETAQYFHLTESRAKGIERSALKLLKHELIIEIPERAYAWAEDRLTRRLVAEGELHAVELRLKSQQKRGRKITAVVYEYLADCDGKWGELRYNFKDDTAEVLLLADWDTIVSRRFAMRAVEYLRRHRAEAPPERLLLTFISPEQIECCGR